MLTNSLKFCKYWNIFPKSFKKYTRLSLCPLSQDTLNFCKQWNIFLTKKLWEGGEKLKAIFKDFQKVQQQWKSKIPA